MTIGGSCIVAPTGEIVAQAKTLEDELVITLRSGPLPRDPGQHFCGIPKLATTD